MKSQPDSGTGTEVLGSSYCGDADKIFGRHTILSSNPALLQSYAHTARVVNPLRAHTDSLNALNPLTSFSSSPIVRHPQHGREKTGKLNWSHR